MTFTEDHTTGRLSVDRLFKPSVNCQDVVDAGRVAFVVDGEAYYGALYESFLRARRSIFIVGWDLHSDTQLVRGSVAGADPAKRLVSLSSYRARPAAIASDHLPLIARVAI